MRLPTRWDHHFESRQRRRERLGWSTALVILVAVVVALLVSFRTAHAEPLTRAVQCSGCDGLPLPVAWRLLFAAVLGVLAGAVSFMIRGHWAGRRAWGAETRLGTWYRAQLSRPEPAGGAIAPIASFAGLAPRSAGDRR